MRSTWPKLTAPAATLMIALAIVAACSGSAPTGSPAASPTPQAASPTPVVPVPTQAPGADTFWLRLSTSQALPPANVFGIIPTVVITGDNRYVVQGAVPAIFPGPLVTPLFARQLSDDGRARILGWAEDLGLLGGNDDFTGDPGMLGGMTGRIELQVNDRLVTLTGMPGGAPAGDVTRGSPEAFMRFWDGVVSLPETLPAELGLEQPFTPSAYAVLVGPPPEPQEGITGGIADWPLDVNLTEFGGPVLDGSYRCGLVEGQDAAVLRPALEMANQLTQWIQDPEMSAAFGLTVRPIVAGENPCAEVFGF